MNRIVMTMLAAVAVMGLSACGPQATKTAPEGVTADVDLAKKVAAGLVANDMTAAMADFDATMTTVISAEQLQEAWDAQTAKLGAHTGYGEPYVEYVQRFPCVFVPVNFANGALTVQVTQDATGAKVTGLYLRPAGFSFL